MDLSRTLGQILLSTFISTPLWGMLCLQSVMYFATYKPDTWHIKSLIIVLLILVSFHEFIRIQFLWEHLIPNFGKIPNRSATDTAFSLEPLLTGIVAALAQSFFTWRIWRFSKESKLFPIIINKLFLIILVPLILGCLVCFMILFKVTRKASLDSLHTINMRVARKFEVGIGGIYALTDVLIAVIMCSLLRSGRTGLTVESDRIIVRLTIASMSTGASTAVFALMVVIIGSILPYDTFNVIGGLPLCAMYCNTVLANLNSRQYIRGTNVVDTSMSIKPPRDSLPMVIPGDDQMTQ